MKKTTDGWVRAVGAYPNPRPKLESKFSLMIEPALLRRIKDHAKKQGRSASGMIRVALSEWLSGKKAA